MAVSYMHSYCEESSGTLVISYFSLQEQQKNGIATPVKATGLQWVVTFKLLFSYGESMKKNVAALSLVCSVASSGSLKLKESSF